MGCDIHGHIEYKRWEGETVDGSPYWSFAENLGTRDYAMFGLLAGVRMNGCVFEPRGLPEDIGHQVKMNFCLYVSDEHPNEEGNTSRNRAESWVASDCSKWMDEEHKFVTGPDWHTPSWLTTEEFEQVLIKRKEHKWETDPEWDAILGAMKALPNARFVFWFDN